MKDSKEELIELTGSIPGEILEHFYARAMTGKTDRLRELVEADPNLIDLARIDPSVVNIVVLECHCETLVYLVRELGVSLETRDEIRRTPLHRLLLLHHSEDRRVNLNDTQKFNFKFEMLQTLIELGVDVNAKDIYGLTPLHIAINNLRLSDVLENDFGERLVKCLMDAKADPNLKNKDGFTALDLALDQKQIGSSFMKPIIDLLKGQLSFEEMGISNR